MNNLEEALDFLKSENGFSEDWVERLFIVNDSSQVESKELFNSRAFNIVEKIYEKLNCSIIGGEYAYNAKNTKLVIESLIEYFTNIQERLIDKNSQEYLHAQSFYQIGIKSMLESIGQYQILISNFERKTDFSDLKDLFDATKKSSFINTFDKNISDQLLLLRETFNLNVKIALSDLRLSVNENCIKELLIYRENLSDNKSPYIYTKVLIEKCNFLLRKITYRLVEYSQSYRYTFGAREGLLDFKSSHTEFFNNYDEYIKHHYDKQIGISNNEFKKKILSIQINNIDEAKTIDIHSCVKYYKDININITQLYKIVDSFNINKKITDNTSQYDVYSINKAKCYFLNNYFSKMIDLEFDEESVCLKFEEIETLQEITNNKNYFPYYRYCTYLLKKIDNIIRLDSNSELEIYNDNRFQKVEKYIRDLDSSIVKLYSNYNWCRENNFIPFQLPYEESCTGIVIDEQNFNLFLFTGFSLPINYNEVYVNIKEISRQRSRIKTVLEVEQTLKNDKRIIRDIRKEMERSDKRSIEILAIFSAVVLFTMGSIQIFSIESITIPHAIKFMLMFAYCLVLFVFLIWVITRENIKHITWVHKSFFALLSLATILSILYIYDKLPLPN